MTGFLALKGLKILANGYKIIPIPLGQKFPRERGWQQLKATPAMVRKWLENGHADSGVGILTGEVVCLDLDFRNREMATWGEQWLSNHFGIAPVRIGNPPKRALIYRILKPIPKISSRKFMDLQKLQNQAEALGDGQQFVSDHIHPEIGRPYFWVDDYGPHNLPFEDLPIITETDIREFIAAFEERALELGWTVIGGGSSAVTPSRSRGEGEPDDDELGVVEEQSKPLHDVSDAELEKLVMSIPNSLQVPHDVGRAPDQLGWLEMMMAIHHQTGGSEFGRDLACRWTESGGYDSADLDRKRWRSFGQERSQRPLTARYIKKFAKIEKARADTRPVVRVSAGRLPEMATEAETALIDQDAPLYSRGQAIVRPVVEEVDATNSRKTKVARLVMVSNIGLVDYMARTARYIRYDMKQKKDVPTDPPSMVAAILQSRDGEWRLRALTGVITTPTLRPDGSLFTEPGYDPATRMLLLQPPPMPDIPNKPTKDQAARALADLDSLLDEFPFTSKASRSVVLSGLLTPLVRGAVPVSPLHVITAPTPASGKSYVVDIVSALTMGRICPVISAGWDVAEMEKRVGAILLAGQQILTIDNLNGILEGDFLCQVVERPAVDIRILGKSEVVKIENRTTLFSTGNNLTIRGDLIRRVIQCSLDPQLERPELRVFKDKPFERVIARRGEFIAATLTVVRAYLEAGSPGQVKPLASFESWSRVVRSALVWLGHDDPTDTMERVRDEDPEIKILRRIIHAWKSTVGLENPKYVSELIQAAGGGRIDITDDDNLEFGQAISELSRGHDVSVHSFGNWLRRHQGRVIDDLKIVSQEDGKKKIMRWWLRDINPL